MVRYTTWGGWYVLGCGKDNPCNCLLYTSELLFAPERSGGIAAEQLVKLCYSGKYDRGQMMKLVRGKSGLLAHLLSLIHILISAVSDCNPGREYV